MALVLGIDASWSPKGSTGVALLSSTRGVIAVAPSYQSFTALAAGGVAEWLPSEGAAPNVTDLLETAIRLGEAPIDVVAIDMPMARTPIKGRRAADDNVSRTFGAEGAGVHSPSSNRPGQHGELIAQAFMSAGFPLITESAKTPRRPALIEVFPLAALVRLMRLLKRPSYKVSKTSRYWPGFSKDARLDRLVATWQKIAFALEAEVGSLGFVLPDRSTLKALASLKPYEDALDAIICAWIGTQYLAGRAEPFGEADAAIWIPKKHVL